jgi:DnaJ domain
MLGMDLYWPIDEASLADGRTAQYGAAAAGLGSARTGEPFLTQIEQVLGEETEPDAAFFVDSWTLGVAEASESLQRRQRKLKSRDCEMPAWNSFSYFTPLFFVGLDASVDTVWPPRVERAEKREEDKQRFGGDKRDEWRAAGEVEESHSLTMESACQVLGVDATSTREQIRAAYRKMAGRHHPDRLARGGAQEKKLASDRMATINEAYRLLCAALAR